MREKAFYRISLRIRVSFSIRVKTMSDIYRKYYDLTACDFHKRIPMDIRLEIYALVDDTVDSYWNQEYLRFLIDYPPKSMLDRQLLGAARMNDMEALHVMFNQLDSDTTREHPTWRSVFHLLAGSGYFALLHYFYT